MNPIEQELVILFNNGDTAAFQVLYVNLSSDLFFYIEHFIKSREEREDIIAETFVKLWSQRGEFETGQKIISFLYVTAKHACLDRIRHSKMENRKQPEIFEAMLRNLERSGTEDAVTNQLLHRIYGAMEKLPKKLRAVIQLFYLEGLKNPEIACRLGIQEKTVRNQKVNALKRLRMSILNTVHKPKVNRRTEKPSYQKHSA